MFIVVSGGQTGADLAGLDAALVCLINTCGHTLKNCRNETGDHPEYVEKYHLLPICNSYPERTEKNIRHSEGTVIFGDVNSPGSRKTINLCKKLEKPFIHFELIDLKSKSSKTKLIRFLSENIYREGEITAVNIAGNRESVSPGIYEDVKSFLVTVFSFYKNSVEILESLKTSKDLPDAGW